MTDKLFITDFDGTLLNDQKRLDEKNIRALEMLGEQGVARGVATGRSIYSFNKILDELGFSGPGRVLPVDYVIFSTGAGIMEFPECTVLKKASLSPSDVVSIADYFEDQGMDYMIHKPVPETKHFVFRSHGSDNPDFQARIELYREFCFPLNGRPVSSFGKATEVLSIVPENESRGVAEKAGKALKEFSVIKATSPLDGCSVWIEVFPKTVSKSQAASWLARQLGIDQTDVVSIGNDYNDLDLLSWSGKGYVVENAPLDLKALFQMVSSNNQCGVAEVISKIT